MTRKLGTNKLNSQQAVDQTIQILKIGGVATSKDTIVSAPDKVECPLLITPPELSSGQSHGFKEITLVLVVVRKCDGADCI